MPAHHSLLILRTLRTIREIGRRCTLHSFDFNAVPNTVFRLLCSALHSANRAELASYSCTHKSNLNGKALSKKVVHFKSIHTVDSTTACQIVELTDCPPTHYRAAASATGHSGVHTTRAPYVSHPNSRWIFRFFGGASARFAKFCNPLAIWLYSDFFDSLSFSILQFSLLRFSYFHFFSILFAFLSSSLQMLSIHFFLVLPISFFSTHSPSLPPDCTSCPPCS